MDPHPYKKSSKMKRSRIDPFVSPRHATDDIVADRRPSTAAEMRRCLAAGNRTLPPAPPVFASRRPSRSNTKERSISAKKRKEDERSGRRRAPCPTPRDFGSSRSSPCSSPIVSSLAGNNVAFSRIGHDESRLNRCRVYRYDGEETDNGVYE